MMIMRTNIRIVKWITAIMLFAVLSICLYGDTNNMIITEERELPVADADGDFGGEHSQSEQVYSGTIPPEGVSFNIIEVVPQYGSATFGYMIGGCEPIGPSSTDLTDKKQIEECKTRSLHYMDAICNLNPGGTNGRRKMNLGIDDGGNWHYGIWYDQNVEGYYEYVGSGKGVYEYVSATGDSNSITHIEMKSKASGDSGHYDYVWNYGQPGSDKKIITDISKLSNGMSLKDVIYFKSYKKNVYCNNESFLTLFYSGGKDAVTSSANVKLLEADVDGEKKTVDGSNGAYKINSVDERTVEKEYFNKKVVDSWKQKNGINVFVRTPGDLSDADIENADLIIFNPGIAEKTDIVDCYNLMNSPTTPYKFEKFSDDNDLLWNQVLTIYDHVVNKQDIAIAMNNVMYRNDLRNGNSNIAKLMWLLYTAIDDNKTGNWYYDSRSDFYNYFLENQTGTSLRSYVKLSEKKVEYNQNGTWKERTEWWKIDDPNPFNECFLLKNTQNDLSKTYAITIDKKFDKGCYKNMMLFESDTEMMKIGYSDDLFRNMLKNRVDVKRKKSTPEPYYISMDIMNGDSKGKGGIVNASNKILYINEYELKPNTVVPGRTYTEKIPIHFRVFSSHDLKSIKIYKNAKIYINPEKKVVEIKNAVDGTSYECIKEYNSGDVFDTDLFEVTDGIKKTVTDSDGISIEVNVKKIEDISETDGEISISIDADDLKNASGTKYQMNTNFVIEVTNSKGKKAADSIKVVKRDFFMLN